MTGVRGGVTTGNTGKGLRYGSVDGMAIGKFYQKTCLQYPDVWHYEFYGLYALSRFLRCFGGGFLDLAVLLIMRGHPLWCGTEFWVTEPRSQMARESSPATDTQSPTWYSERGWWRCFPAPHRGPLRTLTISVNGKRHVSCDDFIVANLAVLGGAVLVDGLHLQDAVVDLPLRHDCPVGWLFEGGSKLIDILHLDVDHGPGTTHRKEEIAVKGG